MAQQRHFTTFGAFSIALLALEWTLFGSMHFILIADTIAQIPDYFPVATRLPIVIVTGVAEVAVGLALLVPSLRQRAAAVSLALLVLLLPAMVEIVLSGGTAKANCTASPATGCIQGWLRAALIPNNILLAIASAYLWRNPGLSLFRTAG